MTVLLMFGLQKDTPLAMSVKWIVQKKVKNVHNYTLGGSSIAMNIIRITPPDAYQNIYIEVQRQVHLLQ